VVAACALALAAAGCGDDDAPGDTAAAVTTADDLSTVAVSAPATTAQPKSDPPATQAPTTDPPPSPPITIDDAPSGLSNEELTAQVEAVLTDALTPGSIRWNSSGVDAPATAAVAAVRIPGRDDVLVAVGDNVDGSPAEADAPFAVGDLTTNLVRTVAFQLIDEGVLDPALTVDQWVPALPNADRVTVQMLIDNETGWGDSDGLIEPDPILSDLGRAWSLREAVELRATVMTALAEPGTSTNDGRTNEAVLGLVIEEVGGQPLAVLIRDRVVEPAGLDVTDLLNGGNAPAGFRHGIFDFGGGLVDTSAFDGTSYTTWEQATDSAVSRATDLLGLLDVWATGELFTTDRTPAPHRYAPEPVLDGDGNPFVVIGVDVPFNGFCPCTEVDGGFEPIAFGRATVTVGSSTFLLRYADGISVVVNVNSSEAYTADIRAVVDEVHDIAATAK
jgi:CubicO group peptidase (beta-lactamase class C family)